MKCRRGWRGAIQLMLDRADAVLMDLSNLSDRNQGCAWDLGQLLDRVPLSQLTLLVNDSTDLVCLPRIMRAGDVPELSQSEQSRDRTAARSHRRTAARQPKESFFEWRRRQDNRLDPIQLTAWGAARRRCWTRTTDHLLRSLTALPNTVIIRRIFLQEKAI